MRHQPEDDSASNVGVRMAPKWKEGLHCAPMPKVTEGDADRLEDQGALLLLQRLQNEVRTSPSQFVARLRRSQLRQNVDATTAFLFRHRSQQLRRRFEHVRISTLLKRANGIPCRVVIPVRATAIRSAISLTV